MTVKCNSIKFKQFICRGQAADYQYMQNLKMNVTDMFWVDGCKW